LFIALPSTAGVSTHCPSAAYFKWIMQMFYRFFSSTLPLLCLYFTSTLLLFYFYIISTTRTSAFCSVIRGNFMFQVL